MGVIRKKVGFRGPGGGGEVKEWNLGEKGKELRFRGE